MVVKSLTIKNFRNHPYLTFDFQPGINIITGENAAGKTNIVEAIYYLSLARSFRGVEDEELIENGKEYAEISAIVQEGELNRKIHIVLNRGAKQVSIV